jgi:hypothetical protein
MYSTLEVSDVRAVLIETVGKDFLTTGIALADHNSAILAMVCRHTDIPM